MSAKSISSFLYPRNHALSGMICGRTAGARLWLVATASLLIAGSAIAASSEQSASMAHRGETKAVPIEKLTLQQRTSLPDETMVSVLHGRRVVSMAALRAEHEKRMQRFANAQRMAVKFRAISMSARPNPSIYANGVPSSVVGLLNSTQGPLIKGSPTNLVKENQICGSMLDCYSAPLPADYRAMCAFAIVSACLYLPPQTYLSRDDLPPTEWWDQDLLVSEAVCKEEGGLYIPTVPACVYVYPAAYAQQFDPGLPPAGKPFGYGLTSSTSKGCTQPTSPNANTVKFMSSIDPHGQFSLSSTLVIAGYDNWYVTTGADPILCEMWVYMPPK